MGRRPGYLLLVALCTLSAGNLAALWDLPNFLLTPHVAGSVRGLLPRAYRLVEDQIRRYRAGQPLINEAHNGY